MQNVKKKRMTETVVWPCRAEGGVYCFGGGYCFHLGVMVPRTRPVLPLCTPCAPPVHIYTYMYIRMRAHIHLLLCYSVLIVVQGKQEVERELQESLGRAPGELWGSSGMAPGRPRGCSKEPRWNIRKLPGDNCDLRLRFPMFGGLGHSELTFSFRNLNVLRHRTILGLRFQMSGALRRSRYANVTSKRPKLSKYQKNVSSNHGFHIEQFGAVKKSFVHADALSLRFQKLVGFGMLWAYLFTCF